MYTIQCFIEKDDKWSDTWFTGIEDYNEVWKILNYCKSNAPHRSYRIKPPSLTEDVKLQSTQHNNNKGI